MRTAAEIRVIDDERIAVVDILGRKALEDGGRAARKGAHMQRQHDVLCDHLTGGIQDCAAGILGFANDGRIAGAEKRILHFLHNTGEARLNHLQRNGIDSHWVGTQHAAPGIYACERSARVSDSFSAKSPSSLSTATR